MPPETLTSETTTTAPWQDLLPNDATIEHDGKAVPLRDLPDIKNAKDLVTLAKGYVESQREIGRRVRLPGKDAKPEDVAAFKKQMTEAGILSAPPASPADYGVTKPTNFPKDLAWSDANAGKFASLLHKHGASKDLATDLLALHQEMVTAQVEGFKAAATGLTTSMEDGIKALKTEFGDQYETRREQAGRLGRQLFKTDEEVAFFERSGLANAPLFLAPLMRLAPLAMQDSAFIEAMAGTGSQAAASAARSEAVDIQRNKDNPKHALWVKGDKDTRAYVDGLYKRVAGEGMVELT